MNLSIATLMKLPLIITGIMNIVEKVQTAKGAAKKDAVLAAIPESVALAELGIGRDLLNDDVVKKLVSDYIDAEAVVINIANDLKAVLVKKATEDVPAQASQARSAKK